MIDMENVLNFSTREEFRRWLQENHNVEKYCWLIVSMSPKPDTILYLDAVEEALCFGWIDSVKKKYSDNQVMQRFSSRTKKSSWTELNKERVRRLDRLGLLTEAGRKILPDMRLEGFIIDEIIEKRLKDDIQTYENFMNFPELYRRIRIDTIHQVKTQPELFNKRLDKLLDNTKQGKMYGAWDDNGRLSE